MTRSFFITGTGTGIGKTIVTCSLAHQLKASGKSVMALKPIISGWEDDINANDTLQILTSLALPHAQENIEGISPWRFNAPLAPSMAARMENRKIDFSYLVDFCKKAQNEYDYLLIEGAGGVMVPLTENKTTLDLMGAINVPAILVTGSYLGSISHTLTAIKALESAKIAINSVIVNESEDGVDLDDTISELKNFINYPIVTLRWVKEGDGFVWERTGDILGVIVRTIK